MGTAELVVVLIAVIAGALIKAVTGMGLPLIAVPIAALFVDVQDAVVVIALPNVLANGIIGAREWDSRHETRDLPTLATVGIIGAVLGTLLLVSVPETLLLVLLVVAVVGYVAFFVLDPSIELPPATSRRWAPAVGLVAGGFQGAIGISGPIVGAWIHSYRLPRNAYVLSVTALFFVSGLTQLVVLIASGELGGRVTATALACIPVLLALPVGTRARQRLSDGAFDTAVVVLLAASAVALGVRVVAG